MTSCLMPFCAQDFVCHYMRFMEQSRDLDQRLGTVLNQAFQDSENLDSTFKVCVFIKNNVFSKAPAAAHESSHPQSSI